MTRAQLEALVIRLLKSCEMRSFIFRVLTIACVPVAGLLASCDNSGAVQPYQLTLKSCWVIDREIGQDEIIETSIREFGQNLGSPVLGKGIQVEIRFEEVGYYVIYNRYIPAYGRMVQTFWGESIHEHPYKDWDAQLRSSLSAQAVLQPCPEDYTASISG